MVDAEDQRHKYSGSTETLESGVTDDSTADTPYAICIDKTKRFFKSAYKAARSLLGLVLIFLLFSILGALLFMAIEGTHEHVYKQGIVEVRDEIVGKLLAQSKTPITNDSLWIGNTKKLLMQYEESIREALQNGVSSNTTEEVWTIWSSLFFVFTVYTTIGYGNVAPVTGFGRIVFILYAGIGIPLALLLLAELGKRFTIALKFLWAYVRRYYQTGYFRKVRNQLQNKYHMNDDDGEKEGEKGVDKDADKDADTKSNASAKSMSPDDKDFVGRSRSGSRMIYGYEIDDEFNLPISVAVGILFVYMFLGAIMYCLWEDWGFIEALYFVFVSLSTIGFGDVLPAHQKFFFFSSIYMYIGLSLVSMCINVAIEFFNSAAVRAKARMGEAKKKLGDKAKMAHKNAKEKVADMKTNIKDETNKFRQKTDENISTLKRNIAGKTANIMEKTDEKLSGIKSNISEETSKFRKRADEKFRKRAGTPTQSTPPPSRNVSRSNLVIEHTVPLADNTYDDIGNVQDRRNNRL